MGQAHPGPHAGGHQPGGGGPAGPGAGGPGLPVHGGVRHPGQAVFPQGRGPSDPPAPRLSGGRPEEYPPASGGAGLSAGLPGGAGGLWGAEAVAGRTVPGGIKEKLAAQLEIHPDAEIYITQGFICRNAYGEIDNLQRGGSDYTASLIGAAVNASEIQIWTDIDGMHDNDPRIVDKTSPVRHLHFEEAAELAYFGAKILHPTCVQPAKYANIPVRLLNTMEPTAPGTLISNDTEKGKIKAVAAKDNITAIKIKSSRMLLAHGFLRKVFEIFESYQTSIDMICTSEVGVSVSIDNTKHLNEILDDLKKYGTVTVDQDMCIICVVGDLEWENVGFEAKALDAMRDIPVRMISFGGSNYNISFLIREEDKKKALQSLSDHLFNNK